MWSLRLWAVLALLAVSHSKDACQLLTEEHACRCDDSFADEPRSLLCEGFDSVVTLTKALDLVRGVEFDTIDIKSGSLTSFPAGLFRGIATNSLTLDGVRVDRTFQLSREASLLGAQSITLKSVRGLNAINAKDVFGGFWFLFHLTIEQSSILVIPTNFNSVGSNGSYLSLLKMNDNGIACMDDFSLATFSEVRLIDLSGNNIRDVRRNQFPLCRRPAKPGKPCLLLESLDLRDNRISYLPEDFLYGFSQLHAVFVGGNRLRTLGSGLVLNRRDLVIDVYDNPLSCDCDDMAWILVEQDQFRIAGYCREYPLHSLKETMKVKGCQPPKGLHLGPSQLA